MKKPPGDGTGRSDREDEVFMREFFKAAIIAFAIYLPFGFVLACLAAYVVAT